MPEAPSLSEAEKLLATMSLVPPREPGEKLRAVDEARLLEWHTAGQSQTDIARAIGCHQVHGRTLAEYSDSRPLARKYLEARALEMTKRLVEDPSPEAILKALGKLDVVREETAGGGTNIVIAVGQPGHSLESPRVSEA